MRRNVSVRRWLLPAMVLVCGLVVVSTGSRVAASGPVEYTWTLAALGQGGWIGGPLFEDGRVGGGGALSINNGQIVALFRPTGWTENDDEEITVCFDVIQKKGPVGGLPPSLCVGPMAVTGTPTRIIIFGSEHVFRITENH
jgi:hypothetical protein